MIALKSALARLLCRRRETRLDKDLGSLRPLYDHIEGHPELWLQGPHMARCEVLSLAVWTGTDFGSSSEWTIPIGGSRRGKRLIQEALFRAYMKRFAAHLNEMSPSSD